MIFSIFLLSLLWISHSFPVKNYQTAIASRKNVVLFNQLGRVTMYKKEGCPYCKSAKELLEDKYKLSIAYVDVEDPNESKREEILQQMRSFTGGRNTVPQVFFNSLHIGGNDDLQKLNSEGKLEPLIAEVKKTPVSMMMDHWYHPWY